MDNRAHVCHDESVNYNRIAFSLVSINSVWEISKCLAKSGKVSILVKDYALVASFYRLRHLKRSSEAPQLFGGHTRMERAHFVMDLLILSEIFV